MFISSNSHSWAIDFSLNYLHSKTTLVSSLEATNILLFIYHIPRANKTEWFEIYGIDHNIFSYNVEMNKSKVLKYQWRKSNVCCTATKAFIICLCRYVFESKLNIFWYVLSDTNANTMLCIWWRYRWCERSIYAVEQLVPRV